MFLRKELLPTRSEEESVRELPIIKLFNGQEVAGNIIEDRDSLLVLEDFSHFSRPKRVIPKADIFSIDF